MEAWTEGEMTVFTVLKYPFTIRHIGSSTDHTGALSIRIFDQLPEDLFRQLKTNLGLEDTLTPVGVYIYLTRKFVGPFAEKPGGLEDLKATYTRTLLEWEQDQ